MLSLLIGGLLRLMPEVFGFLNKRTDNAHELAMTDKQVALEQAKNAARLQELQAMGANQAAADAALAAREAAGADSSQIMALIGAQKDAVAGQMQKIGIWWVDAMNFLVRPLSTYYFLGCYGIVKTSMIIVACMSATPWVSIIQCWSPADQEMLAGILGFWFVGRAFDKAK
jgi:hypothetical protein